MSSPAVTKPLTSTDTKVVMSVRGCGGIGLQLTGTWTGTVSFEATIDGKTWVAFNMVPSNSATAASSATSNGAWSANCAGYSAVQANFSTATSGSPIATLQNADQAGRF